MEPRHWDTEGLKHGTSSHLKWKTRHTHHTSHFNASTSAVFALPFLLRPHAKHIIVIFLETYMRNANIFTVVLYYVLLWSNILILFINCVFKALNQWLILCFFLKNEWECYNCVLSSNFWLLGFFIFFEKFHSILKEFSKLSHILGIGVIG